MFARALVCVGVCVCVCARARARACARGCEREMRGGGGGEIFIIFCLFCSWPDLGFPVLSEDKYIFGISFSSSSSSFSDVICFCTHHYMTVFVKRIVLMVSDALYKSHFLLFRNSV